MLISIPSFASPQRVEKSAAQLGVLGLSESRIAEILKRVFREYLNLKELSFDPHLFASLSKEDTTGGVEHK